MQQECGIDACGIAPLCLAVPRLLGSKLEQVRVMAVRAEAVGVPCGSGMVRLALQAVAFRSEENIAVEVKYLKNTLRCSDTEVALLFVVSNGADSVQGHAAEQRRIPYL